MSVLYTRALILPDGIKKPFLKKRKPNGRKVTLGCYSEGFFFLGEKNSSIIFRWLQNKPHSQMLLKKPRNYFVNRGGRRPGADMKNEDKETSSACFTFRIKLHSSNNPQFCSCIGQLSFSSSDICFQQHRGRKLPILGGDAERGSLDGW